MDASKSVMFSVKLSVLESGKEFLLSNLQAHLFLAIFF